MNFTTRICYCCFVKNVKSCIRATYEMLVLNKYVRHNAIYYEANIW